MSTTTFGSDAGAILVRVALPVPEPGPAPEDCTDAEDHPSGCDCEVPDVDDEDEVEEPTLVLEDGGNCLAYFVDGTPAAWRDLARRIVEASYAHEASTA